MKQLKQQIEPQKGKKRKITELTEEGIQERSIKFTCKCVVCV